MCGDETAAVDIGAPCPRSDALPRTCLEPNRRQRCPERSFGRRRVLKRSVNRAHQRDVMLVSSGPEAVPPTGCRMAALHHLGRLAGMAALSEPLNLRDGHVAPRQPHSHRTLPRNHTQPSDFTSRHRHNESCLGYVSRSGHLCLAQSQPGEQAVSIVSRPGGPMRPERRWTEGTGRSPTRNLTVNQRRAFTAIPLLGHRGYARTGRMVPRAPAGRRDRREVNRSSAGPCPPWPLGILGGLIPIGAVQRGGRSRSKIGG